MSRRIRYATDHAAGVGYVYLSDAEHHPTQIQAGSVILDLDADGNPAGVELLDCPGDISSAVLMALPDIVEAARRSGGLR